MNRPDPSPADRQPATRLLQRGELLKRLWDLMRDEAGGGRHAFIHLKLGTMRSIFGDGNEAEGSAILDCLTAGHDIDLAWLGGDEFALLLRHCEPDEARRHARALHQALLARQPGIGEGRAGSEPVIDVVVFGPRAQNLAVLIAAAGLAGPSTNRGSGIREMVFS